MGYPSSPTTAFLYDIACPFCGACQSWMARKPGAAAIVEGPLVEVRPPVDDEEDRRDDRMLEVWRYPSTLATERVTVCYGCKRGLTIAESKLSAAVIPSPACPPNITKP